ncbi:hypothetical protein [Methylocystis parvus]|uniref:Uncharacterized protein n=1 Tax=Methylocystis parvus TaxID=134 RepID=A0A6B8M274_9HYPH|nr:hypothetical protein [Methylocystis parvus]QGM96425.1 hypothetical protein F7D14_02285 [Methylocystis parvus]WBJ99728.1 hypothetical protein MMG94_17345 [Methylocystis parvus OBBP]
MAMTYVNLDAKCGAPRDLERRGVRAKALEASGVMPTHVFLRLFLSALAATLAIHFWRQGAR